MIPPSGEQIALVHGDLNAVVTEVGATLRCLRVGSRPLLWEFPEAEIDSGARGQILAPWPNRLEDGSYRFADKEGKAALDEPDRHNAIHGLVRWLPWKLEANSAEKAELSCVIHPQPAYPFRIRLEVAYELGRGGLEVRSTATNTGNYDAPFGIGFHPYLAAGPEGIDRARLELAASRRLLLDGRGLPTGLEEVRGTAFDLDGKSLTGLELDDCYTGVVAAADDRWHCLLESAPWRTEIWADAAFAYVMCFTPGSPGGPSAPRPAIAIEPMTCPPNALRTGTDLIVLRPGEPWQAAWGITAQ